MLNIELFLSRTLKAFFILTLYLMSHTATALDLGWNEITDTHMRDVCPENTPDYAFHTQCRNVINAWSGGVFDTLRNRLIIWGGGHGDYYGNEVYALNLNTFKFNRLTDPSSGFDNGECIDALPDGNPTSRHTYGGLEYIAHADVMFAYGGSRACGSGGFGNDTWTFDFSNNTWKKMKASGPNPGRSVVASAYDPVTRKVYVRNIYSLFAYDYDTDTWEELSSGDVISGFEKASAVIDPVRRKYIVIGSAGVHVIDLNSGSDYMAQSLATSGPQTIINDGRSPGLAYDPVRDKIVAWDGSDRGTTPEKVYTLDLDSSSWNIVDVPDGGPAGGNTRGTFGRWRYVPGYDAFVVVNNVDENAFLFKFEAGSLPPLDSIAPGLPTELVVD